MNHIGIGRITKNSTLFDLHVVMVGSSATLHVHPDQKEQFQLSPFVKDMISLFEQLHESDGEDQQLLKVLLKRVNSIIAKIKGCEDDSAEGKVTLNSLTEGLNLPPRDTQLLLQIAVAEGLS